MPQHPTPRDPGGLLLTWASGNKQDRSLLMLGTQCAKLAIRVSLTRKAFIIYSSLQFEHICLKFAAWCCPGKQFFFLGCSNSLVSKAYCWRRNNLRVDFPPGLDSTELRWTAVKIDLTGCDVSDTETNNPPQPWLKGHLLGLVFTQKWPCIIQNIPRAARTTLKEGS